MLKLVKAEVSLVVIHPNFTKDECLLNNLVKIYRLWFPSHQIWYFSVHAVVFQFNLGSWIPAKPTCQRYSMESWIRHPSWL